VILCQALGESTPYLISKDITGRKGGGCRTSSSQEALVVMERRMHDAEGAETDTQWCHACIL